MLAISVHKKGLILVPNKLPIAPANGGAKVILATAKLLSAFFTE